MIDQAFQDIILFGFAEGDLRVMGEALAGLDRSGAPGDPAVDKDEALVFAAAYDETSLRGQRAAAVEDWRPWCFCVPAADRALLGAAIFAREGRILLMPPEGRELKRVLSALLDDAKDRGYGSGGLASMGKLEAELSWRTSAIDVSRSCRRIARILAETGFYADLASEDECALALEEALVNAIEHGNLDLDSSLRPGVSQEDDRYEAERERRLADPAYGGKLVFMRIAISREEAAIEIEDQGDGFDVGSIAGSPSGADVSGKGYWLIRQPFDKVAYSEKGNKLTLIRRRPGLDGNPERRHHGHRTR
jgi:anti-sigma regulatory factor (Ser/Thr protein kinase)